MSYDHALAARGSQYGELRRKHLKLMGCRHQLAYIHESAADLSRCPGLHEDVAQRRGLDRAGDHRFACRVGRELAEQLVLRSTAHDVHHVHGAVGQAFRGGDGLGVTGGEAVRVALIGYDDIDFAASAVVPLSSIRQPTQALGRTAIELLVEEAEGESPHHRAVIFTPELVVSQSTGAAQSTAGAAESSPQGGRL
jgi:hypothetical protein